MSWIQTRDNQKFDLRNPDSAAIDPETLSVVLSRICRFGGHCIDFYSVAQHSLLVESLIGEPKLKLPALLHDAHEAYWGFGDVCRPAKHLSPEIQTGLIRHSWRVDKAIGERFGFDHFLLYDPTIKHADNVLLATEQRDLMGPTPEPWVTLPTPMPERICVLSPEVAAAHFLTRLNQLQAGG